MEEEISDSISPRAASWLGAAAFVAAAVWLTHEYTRRSRELEKVQAYNAALRAQVERLRNEIQDLRNLAVGLQSDPFCIERRARETFGLMRPGERPYAPVKVVFQKPPAHKPAPKPTLSNKMCELLTIGGGRFYENRFLALTIIFGLMGLLLMLPGSKRTKGRGTKTSVGA